MKSQEVLKNRVLEEIEKLPKSKLQEMLDFVGYLISKDRNAQTTEPEEELDPSQDPILRMVGRVSHGSLAKNIDKELYGE
jgi:hypothetical protein